VFAEPEPPKLAAVPDPPAEPEPEPQVGGAPAAPQAALADLLQRAKATEGKTAPAKSNHTPPPPAPDFGDVIGEALTDSTDTYVILLYGQPGSGKTTAALRVTELLADDEYVLLINAEAGAKQRALRLHGIRPEAIKAWPSKQHGPNHITFDNIEREVVEPLRKAREAGRDKCRAVVIDSYTEVARYLLEDAVRIGEERAARNGKTRQDWQVELGDHGIASQMLRAILRQLRDAGPHLVITALERRDVDQNTSAVGYGPAVPPAVANDALALADVVGWCVVEEVAGAPRYFGRFTTHLQRKAKDRFNVLPARMVDPWVDRIVDYIEEEMTLETDDVRAALLAEVAARANATANAAGARS